MIDRISRRSMLTGAVAAGAASLASSVVSAAPATKWDETVDVIVIGSGFAGLAAAIEAKKAGANVVVLEKMPTAGGNSIINGGILTATGCPQQKKAGIEDSFDLLEKDILVAGNYMNDKAKVHLLAQSALSNFEWTVKELGIPIRLRTYVQNIIRTEKGVEGVRVREGYRFPNEGSGKEKTIRATKGVVLCYGGFSADVKFRMFQDPKLDGSLDTTNQPGATSELWRETMAIGCLQVQDDWIQCGPWTSPREKGMGIGWQFSQTAAAEYGLWVNSDGKRFVNELANRKVRADAIMVEGTAGKKCFAICNEANVAPLKKQRPGFLERMLERKIVEKYDTLDELAKAAGINAENLKKEVAAFNEIVKNKVDPVWGRYINNAQTPLTEGPWYYGDLLPKVHHCMGGLVTDNDCRVLDVRTDKPIPHLYAAGEATGMVHGAVRLGSVAILDCLVFGRICGQKVAAEK